MAHLKTLHDAWRQRCGGLDDAGEDERAPLDAPSAVTVRHKRGEERRGGHAIGEGEERGGDEHRARHHRALGLHK